MRLSYRNSRGSSGCGSWWGSVFAGSGASARLRPGGIVVARLDVGTTALHVLVPGGVDSVMSLQFTLCEVGLRGSSAGGFRRAGLSHPVIAPIPASPRIFLVRRAQCTVYAALKGFVACERKRSTELWSS